MYRIKLLILFSASFIFFGCISNNHSLKNFGLSVGYVEGEFDGLLLSNTLRKYLNNLNILDENSNYRIQSSIIHSSNLFITNIDNTSDRERVVSFIDIKIYNTDAGCFSYALSDEVTQFYVLASSDKFTSNKSALEEIKSENTEYLVKKFINDLNEDSFVCN